MCVCGGGGGGGHIQSLLIPTMCMLPDLFCMLLPQRGHIYEDFQSPRTSILSHPFPSFFWFWAHRYWSGVKHVYNVILTFPYSWDTFSFQTLYDLCHSVCWKFDICLLSVYFMAMVNRPHSSFKAIPPKIVR